MRYKFVNVISLSGVLILSIESVLNDVGLESVEMWEMSLGETDGKTIPSHVAFLNHCCILLNQKYELLGAAEAQSRIC